MPYEQLADRLFTILNEQRGRWTCHPCLAQFGVEPADLRHAVAALYAEQSIRAIRGVCFFCGLIADVIST